MASTDSPFSHNPAHANLLQVEGEPRGGGGGDDPKNRKTLNLGARVQGSESSFFEPAPTQLKYRNCKQEHDTRGPFLRGCFPSKLPSSGMPPRFRCSGPPESGPKNRKTLNMQGRPAFKSLHIFRRAVGGDTFRQNPIATRPGRPGSHSRRSPKPNQKTEAKNLQILRKQKSVEENPPGEASSRFRPSAETKFRLHKSTISRPDS